MTPYKFKEANAEFRAPNAYDASQVATIPAFVGKMEGGNMDGAEVTIVAWMPSAEEVESIVAGSPVYLCVMGGLPPHSLATEIKWTA